MRLGDDGDVLLIKPALELVEEMNGPDDRGGRHAFDGSSGKAAFEVAYPQYDFHPTAGQRDPHAAVIVRIGGRLDPALRFEPLNEGSRRGAGNPEVFSDVLRPRPVHPALVHSAEDRVRPVGETIRPVRAVPRPLDGGIDVRDSTGKLQGELRAVSQRQVLGVRCEVSEHWEEVNILMINILTIYEGRKSITDT